MDQYYKYENLALKLTNNGFYIKENGKERRMSGEDWRKGMMITMEGKKIDEEEYNNI